jgi:23S rRNA pseudouridine2605 synthase
MTKESRPSTSGTGAGAVPEDEARVVPMRLQKFLARAGVASRRGSEDLMTAERVTVNGAVITELGFKVDPLVDEVAVDGKVVRLEQGCAYYALNKPRGYMTTMSDPEGRRTVAELFPKDAPAGLFPVGRLDFDTEGLLLLTTDGDLSHVLLHPSHHVTKVYLATVKGVPSPATLAQLRKGVELDDGMTAPAGAVLVTKTGEASHETGRSVVELRIREGRKRQVRRMLSAVGHPVVRLQRVSFGPIVLGELPAGDVRPLTNEEVEALRGAGR